MLKKNLICAFAASLGAMCFASDTSEAAGVFVDPDASLLWRTAPSSSVTIPIEYPPMASSVDISVTGVRYSALFPGVTAATQVISLPAPATDSDENVYEVVLGFNDGTTNKCAFALVRSQSANASCPVKLTSAAKWSRISVKKVMVIPAGQSLSIDDEAVSTGMDGAWGWFACPRLVTGEHEFVLSGDGDVSRTMEFVVPGIVINMR
jgi:hypothetical protein